MKNSELIFMVSDKEVYAYREIYYEHMKPAVRNGKTEEETKNIVEIYSETYGISYERFMELHTIDFYQRFVLTPQPKNIKFIVGGIDVDEINKDSLRDLFKNIPELRCPKRTEQK